LLILIAGGREAVMAALVAAIHENTGSPI
jgi:hypothetical protein